VNDDATSNPGAMRADNLLTKSLPVKIFSSNTRDRPTPHLMPTSHFYHRARKTGFVEIQSLVDKRLNHRLAAPALPALSDNLRNQNGP
jgi:hypothetical protein